MNDRYTPDWPAIVAADRAALAAAAWRDLAWWSALWLALVVAAVAVTLCVYGAAWIDGAWLAPFGR